MKARTIFLTIGGIIVAIAALDTGVAFFSSSEAIAAPIDLTDISVVEVTGDASRLNLSTDTAKPQTAILAGRREGWGAVWKSGWFYSDDCRPNATMRTEGNRLIVHVGGAHSWTGWSDWSDCTVELSANLQPQAAVTINQEATRTDLNGEFSLVNVQSNAGDITFDGHATDLSISGTALRARAIYRRVAQDETIKLAGKMMDASLRFIQPTPISYLVEATASLVDSALPNTPGAKPEITVKGEMLRLKIE